MSTYQCYPSCISGGTCETAHLRAEPIHDMNYVGTTLDALRADRDRLTAECERLTKERDEAVAAREQGLVACETWRTAAGEWLHQQQLLTANLAACREECERMRGGLISILERWEADDNLKVVKDILQEVSDVAFRLSEETAAVFRAALTAQPAKESNDE